MKTKRRIVHSGGRRAAGSGRRQPFPARDKLRCHDASDTNRRPFIRLRRFRSANADHTTKPTLRELTIENIYDPKHRVAFSGAPQGGFVWLDDKTFTWPATNQKGDI